MSRRYADPILVTLAHLSRDAGESVPQRFRWRHRQYRVVAVLARWVEADAWWRSAVPGRRTDRRAPAPDPGMGTFDRVLWRVEAQAGGRVGVYDLCHEAHPRADPAAAAPDPPATAAPPRWFLVRAMD